MSLSARRAWIENIDDFEPSNTRKSLSARRAWIEKKASWTLIFVLCVALRKESVDRKGMLLLMYRLKSGSLSARRAWIEKIVAFDNGNAVACRSPQGERG